MENDNVLDCFEYVGNQIKAYVVNRLANAPCTTAQLVGSFSMIVDHLSISESSLVRVLDALYAEKVITFTLVNNSTRLYSLVNFDKDYIFELNIEKVERMIAEYKIPYFSDHRKNVESILYFEARKNRTCIYLNAPITVNNNVNKFDSNNSSEELHVENQGNNLEESISEREITEVAEETQLAESNNKYMQKDAIVDETKEIEISENEFNYDDPHNQILADENENSESALEDDEELSVFDIESAVTIFDSNDCDLEENSEQVVVEEPENITQESIYVEENSISDAVQSENIVEDNTISNPIEPKNSEVENRFDNIQENKEIEPETVKEKVVKSDFDSIDFSSIDDHSTAYDQNSSSSSADDMDFEQKFAEALAKAMAQTNLSSEENDESKVNETQACEKTSLFEAENEAQENVDALIERETTLSETNGVTPDNEEIIEENPPVKSIQTIADEITFTEVPLTSEPTLSAEEEREKQERALRMMEEILENKNSSVKEVEEQKDEIQFEEINDRVDSGFYEPIIPQNKPEKDALTLYIKEQERINNYDWHNRLKRALVDVPEEVEEEKEKNEEIKISSTYSELRTIMASKNYIFKAYPSHESKSFYTENYVFTNRLARDTAIFTYLFALIEIFLAYFFLDKFIDKGIPFYIIVAVTLLIIPIFFLLKYIMFKDKRKPANFVFGLSLVTSLMIYINLMVMVVLVAFFVPTLQVDVNNLKTMILTIFYPAGIFLLIPMSVCIYALLYRSKRYHLH